MHTSADETTLKRSQGRPFVLVYNLEQDHTEQLKLLNIDGASIEVVNYGPFDNGYLLLGLSSGKLLALDLLDMEVILNLNLFDCPIKSITFEPTNLVFVASERKEMVALNLVKR